MLKSALSLRAVRFRMATAVILLGFCLTSAHFGSARAEAVAPVAPTTVNLPTSMTLFIGTYTKDTPGGICVTHFDSQSGQLQPAEVAADSPNASFLALSPDARFLYATNETGAVAGQRGGALSAYQIGAQGELTALNEVSLLGGPCHLQVDSSGHFLLAATYGAGNVSVWRLEKDGSIGAQTALVQHEGHSVNPSRQKGPHAHQVILSPDNRLALVADLGLDKLMLYAFDAQNGTLQPNTPPFAGVAPGEGPRHVVFDPSGRFVYLANEMGNSVSVFSFNGGAPQELQTISTLPAGFEGKTTVAEIMVHPDGRTLYVSNRGHDSIAIFSIATDGRLTLTGHAPTQGRNPRHFTIDPSGRWLLAANQNDHSIIVFRIEADGALTQTSLLADVPGDPVCLCFLPANRSAGEPPTP